MLADQHLQGMSLDRQIILRGKFLGRDEVEAGLRFVAVGNRCGADFEVAPGGFELLGGRRFLRLVPWPGRLAPAARRSRPAPRAASDPSWRRQTGLSEIATEISAWL
jgi:hypothetical protein